MRGGTDTQPRVGGWRDRHTAQDKRAHKQMCSRNRKTNRWKHSLGWEGGGMDMQPRMGSETDRCTAWDRRAGRQMHSLGWEERGTDTA